MATAGIDNFIPIVRFLLCFVVTILAILSWRVVPGAVPRHLYAAFSEADLSIGASFNVHFIIPVATAYAAVLLLHRYAGVITFFTGFDYPIGW